MENFRSKTSAIDKIVADSSENIDVLKRNFEESRMKTLEEIMPYVREKMPEEIELLTQVQEKLQSFIESYGGIWHPIPIEEIYFLDGEKMNNLPKDSSLNIYKPNEKGIVRFGTFSANLGGIIMSPYTMDVKLKFAETVVHEMIHYQSFHSSAIRTIQGIEIPSMRRSGFAVVQSKGKGVYFSDVDEAVVGELTKRFCTEEIQHISVLRTEYEKKNEIKEKIREWTQSDERVKEKNNHINETLEDISIFDLEKEYENPASIPSWRYGRKEERRMLKDYIEHLYENNRESYSSPEEIFKLFSQAVLNGKLLPIARLIEKTDGPGSFRTLGEQTKENK